MVNETTRSVLDPMKLEEIQISSIGVKKNRNYIERKSGRDTFHVYQVVIVPEQNEKLIYFSEDQFYEYHFRLQQTVKEYDVIFKDELPERLLHKPEVDNEIETNPNEKMLHRSIFNCHLLNCWQKKNKFLII